MVNVYKQSQFNFTHQKYCVDFFTFSEICWLLWPHLSQSEFCFLVWPLAILMPLSSKWTSLDMDIICYTYFFIHSSLTYLFCDAIINERYFCWPSLIIWIEMSIMSYFAISSDTSIKFDSSYGSEMHWFFMALHGGEFIIEPWYYDYCLEL